MYFTILTLENTLINFNPIFVGTIFIYQFIIEVNCKILHELIISPQMGSFKKGTNLNFPPKRFLLLCQKQNNPTEIFKLYFDLSSFPEWKELQDIAGVTFVPFSKKSRL